MRLPNIEHITRLVLNDFKERLPTIIRNTLGVMCAAILGYIYLIIKPQEIATPESDVGTSIFMVTVLIFGASFTATIFKSLHSPLENIHYLMTPSSSLEKLLAKYLISGPFFVIYMIAVYFSFEVIARTMSLLLFDSARFVYFINPTIITITVITYLSVHIYLFFGSILFKRNSLANTILSFILFSIGVGICFEVGSRIFEPNYITEFYTIASNGELQVYMNPWLIFRKTLGWAIPTSLYCWVFYLSFLCLKDTEI